MHSGIGFVVLAEELHFSRAAQRLNISQPPLSASIRLLQEELGVRLIDRTSRSVALTAAGAAFAERSRRLLRDLDDARYLARSIAAAPGGIVRVGFVPTMIFRTMPAALGLFARLHGEYSVELHELNSSRQIEALMDDRIDLGFAHQVSDSLDIASAPVSEEAFAFCLPTGHRLALRADIAPAEVVGEPLIMFARERAPTYHDQILALFHAAGCEPRIAHIVENWLTIVALVGHGFGCAVVPASLGRCGLGQAVFVPVSTDVATYGSFCIWSKTRAHAARDCLIACVQEASREAA